MDTSGDFDCARGYRENSEYKQLEKLIEQLGLGVVLEQIAELCLEKAKHIRASSGNDALAKALIQDARNINALAVTFLRSTREAE